MEQQKKSALILLSHASKSVALALELIFRSTTRGPVMVDHIKKRDISFLLQSCWFMLGLVPNQEMRRVTHHVGWYTGAAVSAVLVVIGTLFHREIAQASNRLFRSDPHPALRGVNMSGSQEMLEFQGHAEGASGSAGEVRAHARNVGAPSDSMDWIFGNLQRELLTASQHASRLTGVPLQQPSGAARADRVQKIVLAIVSVAAAASPIPFLLAAGNGTGLGIIAANTMFVAIVQAMTALDQTKSTQAAKDNFRQFSGFSTLIGLTFLVNSKIGDPIEASWKGMLLAACVLSVLGNTLPGPIGSSGVKVVEGAMWAAGGIRAGVNYALGR